MADEIEGQNTIKVVLDGDRWVAFIGPDIAGGIASRGCNSAPAAIAVLALKLCADGYIFDESWVPRKAD